MPTNSLIWRDIDIFVSMKGIPVDRLQQKTNIGLQIKVFKSDDKLPAKMVMDGAHRDDHYIFFLLTNGSGSLMIELQNVVLSPNQLYYITPSQVHHRIKTEDAEGWFLAVDTSLIPLEFRNVFEHRETLQEAYNLSDYELKQYSALLALLREEFTLRKTNDFYLPVINSLLQTFLAMAASNFAKVESKVNSTTRPDKLTSQFKNLLSIHSHTLRSPSEYASKLYVSLGYLNESVKKTTGATVSYWIQQEIFTEAKRLLYHTDVDVKQIAIELGYADYSYFSRSFRKASGMSPTQFRVLSRK